MNSKDSNELVPVRYLMKGLGYTTYGQSQVDKVMNTYKPTIVSELKYGQGYMRMMTKAEADAIIARNKREAVDKEEPSTLHLGALETKIDRLVEREQGNEQAISELIRAHNALVMRLDKVLQQLGATV